MVPKGGEYESDTQNLDICKTRKLYVSKFQLCEYEGYKAESSPWHAKGFRVSIQPPVKYKILVRRLGFDQATGGLRKFFPPS